jgi:hypothetical protein
MIVDLLSSLDRRLTRGDVPPFEKQVLLFERDHSDLILAVPFTTLAFS